MISTSARRSTDGSLHRAAARVVVAAVLTSALTIGITAGCGRDPAVPVVNDAPAAVATSGFVESAAECGITFQMRYLNGESGETFKVNLYDHGAGVTVADYDQDGDDDIYFVNQMGGNALYRNDGVAKDQAGDARPHFTDVTAVAGVAMADRVCVASTFADVDGDGDLDLFVTSTRGGNILFRNDGKDHFTDVTAAAGLVLVRHCETPAFFDADGDGDLDLLVTNTAQWTTDVRDPTGRYYEGLSIFFDVAASRVEQNTMYRNDGLGPDGVCHFTDVTEASGLGGPGWGGDVAIFDADDDGKLDVFIGNMFGRSTLFRNMGAGVFTDTTKETLGSTSWGAVGAKLLDYDGDGRLDLFIVDMHSDMWEAAPGLPIHLTPGARFKGPEGPLLEQGRITLEQRDNLRAVLRGHGKDAIYGNSLLHNLGGGRFEETGLAAGVETWWPWGATAADFDMDGDQDIYVSAGMGYPFFYWPSSYLRNDGTGKFTDVARDAGIEPPRGGEKLPNPVSGKPAMRSARCPAVGDFDGDGRPDLVVNNFNDGPSLFLNRFRARSWISLKLRGAGMNRDAIGATATIVADGKTMVHIVESTGGYLSQGSRTLQFGLGDRTAPVTVTVRWPDGRTQEVTGLELGRVHEILQR